MTLFHISNPLKFSLIFLPVQRPLRLVPLSPPWMVAHGFKIKIPSISFRRWRPHTARVLNPVVFFEFLSINQLNQTFHITQFPLPGSAPPATRDW